MTFLAAREYDTHPAYQLFRHPLELLAWTELVEDAQLYSAKKHNDRSAYLNLAELLSRHSISTALPGNLNALTTEATKHNCATGPEIITRMRNGVIHPSRRKPTFPYQAWEDAWRLVMHYLQLALLAYAGYQGTHRDPLFKEKAPGDVQQVPWAAGPGTPQSDSWLADIQ